MRIRPGEQAFRVIRPKATHFRRAKCEEVDCNHYLNGWMSIVPRGSLQEHYIRYESGRSFREESTSAGMVTFIFAPGQRCFRSDRHFVPNGRPEIYAHKTYSGGRRHTRAIDWVEHMNEEMYRIKPLLEQRREMEGVNA